MARHLKYIQLLGKTTYIALLPLLLTYSRVNRKPRTRAVITYKDQVLLVKNLVSLQGWSLPGGGINRNETSVEAVVREVKEEVGLTINTPTLIFRTATPERAASFLVDVFAITLSERPTVTIDGREIIDYCWATFDSPLIVDNLRLKNIVNRATESATHGTQ